MYLLFFLLERPYQPIYYWVIKYNCYKIVYPLGSASLKILNELRPLKYWDPRHSEIKLTLIRPFIKLSLIQSWLHIFIFIIVIEK